MAGEVLIDGVDYNWVPITTDSGLDAGGSIAIHFSSRKRVCSPEPFEQCETHYKTSN